MSANSTAATSTTADPDRVSWTAYLGLGLAAAVLGVVNYVTGASVWLSWPQKNNVGFRQLLQQVLAVHASTTVKIVIVVDNFRIHKAKAVQAWLQRHRGNCACISCPRTHHDSIRLSGYGITFGAT